MLNSHFHPQTHRKFVKRIQKNVKMLSELSVRRGKKVEKIAHPNFADAPKKTTKDMRKTLNIFRLAPMSFLFHSGKPCVRF